MHRAMVVLLLAVAAALTPTEAGAQITWQPPQPPLTAAGVNVANVRVAMGPNGDAAASWIIRPPSNNTFPQASLRTPGGYLEAAKTLEERGSDPTPAVAPDGRAVVTYESSGPRPRAAIRPGGGSFGLPQSLAQSGQTTGLGHPVPRFEPDGRISVFFEGRPADPPYDRGLFRTATTDAVTFGGPAPVTTLLPVAQDRRTQQDVAFAPDGAALLVWRWNPNLGAGGVNDADFIYAAYKPAGSDTFGAEVQVPNSRKGFRPHVVYGGNGEFVIAFNVDPGNVFAVTRTAQGTWRSSGTRAEAEYLRTNYNPDRDNPTGAEVQLAGNADGLVALSYVNGGDGPSVMVKKPGEWFGDDESPQGRTDDAVTHGSSAHWTDVAVDAAGDVVTVWGQTYNGRSEIRAGYRPAGGPFVARPDLLGEPISDPAVDSDKPRIAVDDKGNAVVAWEARILDPGNEAHVAAQATYGTQPSPAGTTPPPPPPPPSPTPSPVPTPPPGVAAVTDLKVEMPLQRNAPVVVTAVTAGPVKELRWGNGTAVGRTYGNQLQRSYRFRTDQEKFTVSVRAIGPGASSTPYSESYSLPRDKTRRAGRSSASAAISGSPYESLVKGLDPEAVRTIKAKLSDGDATRAVGSAGNLTGAFTDCNAPTTVITAKTTLTGCLKAVPGLAQIPSSQLGALDALRSRLRISSDPKLTAAAVALSDGFVTADKLDLPNGFTLEPSPGAKIMFLPQAQSLSSSSAGFRVGGDLIKKTNFQLAAQDLDKPVDLGAVPKLPNLPKIGGFDIGDFTVRLDDGQAVISGALKLPSILQVGGDSAQASFTMRATPDAYILDDITIGPIDVSLSGIGIEAFKVSYTRATDEWYGQGKACLPGDLCLDMIPPDGHVSFIGGRFNYAGATLGFGPGIPLFPGIDLRSISFGFGLNPTRFTGGAAIRALDFVGLDGRMVMAFPSAAEPYRLNRDEVGNDFGAQLYDYTYTHFVLGVSAGISLVLPIVGDTKLGNGYFLYEYPGYVAFGGGFDVNIAEIVYLRGGVSGELEATKGYFNLHGDVEGCVDLKIEVCAGAVAHVGRGAGNSGGVGACVSALGLSVGGGYVWKTRKPKIWPLDGCKWSIYKAVVRTRADAPMMIEPGQALQIDGMGDAPMVKVTAPDGTVTQTTPESGLTASDDKKVRILRYAKGENAFTVVGVQEPASGRYKVEPVLGSVPVTGMSMAEDPPDAKVAGSVSGTGDVRTLAYDVAPRDNQVVTFLDTAPGGAARSIGRVTAGGAGKLDFKPAPGRGKHTITAQFELAGIPAEIKKVATFTPPSQRMAKPGILRTKRTARGLHVKWLPVSGATSYEVVATVKGGGQKVLRTKKRP